MPVGHPKDPAAHAAVLEANRLKRAMAKKTSDDLSALQERVTGRKASTKRKHVRKTGQARKEAFTAFDATTIRDLEEELKHKDKLIDDLEVHVAELQTGIARLRDDLIRVRVDRAKAEARVETVLDLAAKLV